MSMACTAPGCSMPMLGMLLHRCPVNSFEFVRHLRHRHACVLCPCANGAPCCLCPPCLLQRPSPQSCCSESASSMIMFLMQMVPAAYRAGSAAELQSATLLIHFF